MKNLKQGEIKHDPKLNENIIDDYRKISNEDFKKFMHKFLPHFQVLFTYDDEALNSDECLYFDITATDEQGTKTSLREKDYICIVESSEKDEGRSLYINGGFYVLREKYNKESEDEQL